MLYALGGKSANDEILVENERFHVRSNEWEKIEKMPQKIQKFKLLASQNTIYCFELQEPHRILAYCTINNFWRVLNFRLQQPNDILLLKAPEKEHFIYIFYKNRTK
jgi:hypothetical protein